MAYTTYSRCFNALKIVTEKSMIVKLPMHEIRVDHLKFVKVSYSAIGSEILLEFERLPEQDAYNKFKEQMRIKHSNEAPGGFHLY